jgi:hypothetical protein
MVSTGTLTRSDLPEVVTTNDRRLLQLGALAGAVGLALRFLATGGYQNPLNANPVAIVGYPESGLEPAVAGGLGALFVTFALVVLYRSMSERDLLRTFALAGVGAVLALTLLGIPLSVDSGLFGSVFVAFGLAIATGRTYQAWLGWLGVASGVGLIVVAVASVQIDISGKASELERVTAAAAGLFVLAMSIAMWLRSRVPSPLKGAK